MKDTVLTKKSIGSKVAFGFTFILFLLYSLTIIYTLFWLFTNSLKTVDDWDASKFSLPVEFIKSGLLFDNYTAAWTELNYDGVGVPGMLFNSVWYSVGGAFVAVWFCCLTAYVISKYTFVGRNLIYTVAIIQMVLPIVGNLPATYKMYNDLNITNSPLLLIVNAGGLGGNFMILYATFQGVSNSYMEAAKIDGAGHYSILFQVMLPQAMPTMFAIFLLGFIGSWNDYMGPLLYLEDYPTLATGLMVFEKDMIYNINMPVFYAGTVILVLPTIVLFAIFSDKMMTSVSIGGLKG
jgi:ABC-type glycerol-3-phosphate transport system permease component